ncbi:MAG: hypothetical protein KKD39_08865 [Candidatus Altiarchaeota archaeon]|nr:hypothetical protein [Candidatus Altiarchaeota archaeon]
MIGRIISSIFGVFKKAVIPDRKDLLGSIILTIPLYLVLGLGLIFLLPLIIIGVVLVYFLRRLWKVVLMYITYKIFRKKVDKKISSIKKLIK